jgi:hypothetical protein
MTDIGLYVIKMAVLSKWRMYQRSYKECGNDATDAMADQS